MAVRVTVPLAPLSLTSTSFAFTVVSAAAIGGRHSAVAAKARMSELRNFVMDPPFEPGRTACSVALPQSIIRFPHLQPMPKHPCIACGRTLPHRYTLAHCRQSRQAVRTLRSPGIRVPGD